MAYEPNVRGAAHTTIQGAPQQDKDIVDEVCACAQSFENSIGSQFRDRNIRFFQQYRGFRKWRDAWTKAGPNDRDGLVYDAKKHWGSQLHIPLSYRTIETLVPRAIANPPKLIYLPREEQFAANAGLVSMLVDAQLENIDIDLPFQAVMRSGRIYGIGVGKTYWRKEYSLYRPTKRKVLDAGAYVRGKLQTRCDFDDPYFEDVDIFDFMWDEGAGDLRDTEWVIHRMWPTVETCLQRIESGVWNTATAALLDEDKLRSLVADHQKYDEIWNDRLEASGLPTGGSYARANPRLELLEYHAGHNVYTVLGRGALVQQAEAQALGAQTFCAYRPTPLQKQMIGIGDLEPLEHLQRELDTLRSQRRDAATIALCAGYAYDASAVDEEDLVFGPAAAIRVTNQDPRAAIMPLGIKEVPGSAYEDEKVIRQDFDLISGVSDAVDPNTSTTQTATEAQLVQAALSARIRLSARRFESEVVRPTARAMLRLNQAMILRPRDIRQPEDGLDLLSAAEEGRWKWYTLTPDMLRGEYEVLIPETGAMAERNIPQDRQDAQIYLQLSQDPRLDGAKPLLKALHLLGEKNPESWLAQGDPPVPPVAFQILGRAGVDPRLLELAANAARQSDPRLRQDEGPTTQQVAAMMNGNGGGGG